MIKYPEYEGSKYHVKKITRSIDNWGNVSYKKEVEPSWGYSRYLKEKREYERECKLKVMREKLEYQMRTYGEVDEIDFNEYVNELNRG